RRDPMRQRRRNWCKHISGMKCGAGRLAEEALPGQLPHVELSLPLTNPTKDSVVWPNENLSAAFDRDRLAGGTHSSINNRNVDGAVRKIFVTREEGKGRAVNVLRWNLVRDIDDLRVGIARKDCSLHRGDEIIPGAKVCKQGDDGIRRTGEIFHLGI